MKIDTSSREQHRISKLFALYLGCNVIHNDKLYLLAGIDQGLGCNLFDWHEDTGELSGINISLIKLVLRPLSDIKREEAIDISKMLYAGIDEKSDGDTFSIVEKAMKGEIKGITWLRDLKGCFDVTQYLISKHFDLFGLISDGTAIDLTKIKPIV